MKNMQENRMMSKWRAARSRARVALRRVRVGAGRRTRSSRSTAPSRPARRRAHRAVASRWPPCRPASRSRRRRASRSTCPAWATRSASSIVEINQGNLRSVNVAQAGDRTRLVLNLKQAANYRAQLQGKVLLVMHRQRPAPSAPVAAAAAAATEPVRFAENLNQPQVPLQGHRLPPRPRRRRPRRRRPAEQPGRRRHPPAGPEPGRRVPALDPARQPAPPPRRDRLRHAGAGRLHLPERRPRAHGRRAARRLGAQRLPERQPVRARGARRRRSTRTS